MVGIETKNVFLDLANIDFKCPHCAKEYNDRNDKYLNRCNRNKKGYTKIKCACGKTFGFTYDYKGDAVGFELKIKQ